jgi:hypothetical protein
VSAVTGDYGPEGCQNCYYPTSAPTDPLDAVYAFESWVNAHPTMVPLVIIAIAAVVWLVKR